ncbi:MAG: polysaccharide biosynthesis protein [Clostridium sp.]|nr:polysaccharide biosynthesis protein [Clostridium sp.]
MKKGNKKTGQSKEEKHKKVLTKNNFIQGAFISTLGIVVSKILGIVYVIPFHAIVKEQGGALYGYAYTIYSLFLALSSAGIPLAISKIISEYQTLGYYNAKERAFKIGKQLSIVLGLIAFIILFIFAPEVAHLILGDLKGGNTIEQVTYVIRVISTAILVVPILSIYRGYLEGHKYLTPSSISNVIEQVVRVTLIILGSYLSMKVFHLSLETTVGIAVFGATAGALISYFYLLDITHKSKKELQEKPLKVKEPKITNKAIVKKIFIYALPFIMIDIFKSMYDFIDMSTVVKTIGDMSNYSTKDAESIMSVISTWGSKFNMIISSVSTGIIVSLIPTLTASFVVGNQKDINKKVNQTFQILLLFTMPMTVGLSMLAKPVWMIFYGPSKFGAPVFSYFIYVSLFMSLYTTAVTIIQTLKDYKTVFISLLVGAALKLLLNVSLMNSFNKMGLPPFYGNISATIIGYLVSLIICLYVLHKRYKINYEVTVKEIFNITCATVIMGLVLFLLRFVIPEVSSNRLVNLPIIVVYTLVGAIIYFIVIYKSKTLHTIFGQNNLKKITNKLFKKRPKGASK